MYQQHQQRLVIGVLCLCWLLAHGTLADTITVPLSGQLALPEYACADAEIAAAVTDLNASPPAMIGQESLGGWTEGPVYHYTWGAFAAADAASVTGQFGTGGEYSVTVTITVSGSASYGDAPETQIATIQGTLTLSRAIQVSALAVSGPSSLALGQQVTLLQDGVGSAPYAWQSSAPEIASITDQGVVTGLALGGPVTMTVTDANGCSASLAMTIVPITLSGPEAIAVGETVALTVAGGTAPYTWSSGDPGLATVANQGEVTGGAAGGPVTVTVTDAEQNSATLDLVVYALTAISRTGSIPVGATLSASDFTVTTNPAGYGEGVAIAPLAFPTAGEVTVTATIGTQTASCQVTVVGVAQVIVADSSPADPGPKWHASGDPLTLQAMPDLAGAAWPTDLPTWSITNKPAGSLLFDEDLTVTGDRVALTPDMGGDFEVTATCGSSSAVFIIKTVKVTIESRLKRAIGDDFAESGTEILAGAKQFFPEEQLDDLHTASVRIRFEPSLQGQQTVELSLVNGGLGHDFNYSWWFTSSATKAKLTIIDASVEAGASTPLAITPAGIANGELSASNMVENTTIRVNLPFLSKSYDHTISFKAVDLRQCSGPTAITSQEWKEIEFNASFRGFPVLYHQLAVVVAEVKHKNGQVITGSLNETNILLSETLDDYVEVKNSGGVYDECLLSPEMPKLATRVRIIDDSVADFYYGLVDGSEFLNEDVQP
jgi:hypothetical protein